MQKFYPSVHGQLMQVSFVRTWIAQRPDKSVIHIGLMPNGAYATVPQGFPITDTEDIKLAIPDPEAQARAINWFERRSDPTRQTPLRKIYPDPEDGTWRYLDSHQVVEKQEDIIAATRGMEQQAAITWFAKYHGAHQSRQHDEEARAPRELDDRVLEELREHPGQTTEALGKHFDVKAGDMVRLTQSMESRGMIVRQGRGWHLPITDPPLRDDEQRNKR